MTHTPPRLVSRVLTCVVGFFTGALLYAGPALASPYPDMSAYESVSSNWIYRVVNEDGVWWTTPVGMRCHIDDEGSYGCSGRLPGVPAGENEVAWFAGDPFPRLYRTEEAKFSSREAQNVLHESTFIAYRGSRCATTRDSGVYCIHGDDPNSQLLITNSAVFRGAEAHPN